MIWTNILERVELSQIIDIKRRKKWSHEDLAIYMRIYIRRERNSTKLKKNHISVKFHRRKKYKKVLELELIDYFEKKMEKKNFRQNFFF